MHNKYSLPSAPETSHNLFNIENVGSCIYVHNDKRSLYYLIRDDDSKNVYLVTTDKSYDIEHVGAIQNGEQLYNHSPSEGNIIFTKPTSDRMDMLTFKGFIKTGKVWNRFSIEKGEFKKQASTINIRPSIEGICKGLADFHIYQHIQFGLEMFFIGKDKVVGDNVFGKYNTLDDKVTYIQGFDSFTNDIVVNSFSVDSSSGIIHVAGGKKDLLTGVSEPFIQILLNN